MVMTLTADELRRMLAKIDIKHPFGPRDYFLIVLDYHTGLRVSELAGLNVFHVAHEGVPRQSLHVTSTLAKGRKGRLLNLNSAARKAVALLLAFNQARGLSVQPNAPLLQTYQHTRMTVRAIQRLVERLRYAAGIDFQATPHTLRHTHATDVLRLTGNIRIVQDFLGHASLLSTQVYTHPTRADKAQASEALARRAREV
jgi:site-specific recombinase XerD